MASEFETGIGPALKKVQASLTEALRKDAAAAGWPAEVYKFMSVNLDPSGLSIVYPEELATQIEDLEYGNGSEPPKVIMRTFSAKHDETIGNSIIEASLEYLSNKGVIS